MKPGQVALVPVTFIEDRGGRAVVRLPSGTKTTLEYDTLAEQPGVGHFVRAEAGPGGTVYCSGCDWSSGFERWPEGANLLDKHFGRTGQSCSRCRSSWGPRANCCSVLAPRLGCGMPATGMDLAEQLAWHWSAQLRPRLDGLSDDEYLWQPVPGAWSVHPQPGGGYAPDSASPAPEPAPFTTIAWRVCHVWMVLAQRADFHFGQGVLTVDRLDWPGTAAAALAALDDAYAAWTSGLEACEVGAWDRRSDGPPGTADADFPFWGVVLHVNREVIHHGAEISLLRDFYAARPATE